MKKFFDRLRRWVIKKLGGHTERFTKVQIQITEHRPIEVGQIGLKEHLKSNALKSIAWSLEENGYIKWERTDDIERHAIIFRATICAMRAEDLEPCFQGRVETHGN